MNSGQIKHDWVFEFIIKLKRNECVGCMERYAIPNYINNLYEVEILTLMNPTFHTIFCKFVIITELVLKIICHVILYQRLSRNFNFLLLHKLTLENR